MLKSIFETTTTSSISLVSILICSAVSILLGIIIAFVHKKTSRYSKNFLITLATLPVIVQSVMIMVNGNLGTSVAILGAFGLIRFRSMPGTSKEILSVFFAMAIGLATGMGHIFFAIVMTLVTSLAIIIFAKAKLFDQDSSEKVLKITIPEDLNYTNVFNETFEKYLTYFHLSNVKTINMGSLFELKYTIKTKKDYNEKEFIDELRIKNSNLKIALSQDVDDNEL